MKMTHQGVDPSRFARTNPAFTHDEYSDPLNKKINYITKNTDDTKNYGSVNKAFEAPLESILNTETQRTDEHKIIVFDVFVETANENILNALKAIEPADAANSIEINTNATETIETNNEIILNASETLDEIKLNTLKSIDTNEENYVKPAFIEGEREPTEDENFDGNGSSKTKFDSGVKKFFFKSRGRLFGKIMSKKEPGLEEPRCISEGVELNRSQYSLVSVSDVTPGALEVWVELPDEIRNDSSLAPFRELYEKEHGKSQNTPKVQSNGAVKSKLPGVKSEPLLNNNLSSRDAGKEGGIKSAEAQKGSKELTAELAETKDGPFKDNIKGISTFTKMQTARHYVKMSCLLACWAFFTIIFMLFNEKETVVRHSAVAHQEIKTFHLNSTTDIQRVYVHLDGPFWSEQAEKSRNSSDPNAPEVQSFDVWLETWTLHDNGTAEPEANEVQKSISWRVLLLPENKIDFSEGEPRSSLLTLPSDNSNQARRQVLRIRTDTNRTTPFTLAYSLNPLNQNTGVIYAGILLCGLYGLIIFEIINRTLAAVVISTTALAVLSMIGERPSLPELISWLDVETLLLLFSMMVLVAIMAETGMFDYMAVYTFKITKGRMWPLINMLCFITAALSTFLDNVTTVLLMTPVTIRLCEVMQLNPVPILMAMVIYSNIGGTATPVGDPPNVIIASNRDVIDSGINFTSFTLHMTLGIILVGIQTYFQLRWMYRDVSRLRHSVPKDIQDLKQQITVWRRAAASLATYSQDEELVRAALEKKVNKLNVQLENKMKESKKRAVPKETFQSTLDEMTAKYQIRDKVLLWKATFAIAFVVLLFFLHSIPELQRISLGWTALLGAILLLILADRDDLEHIMNRVEWSTLLFFAALFVLMEALSKLGLIKFIGDLTEKLILQVDEGSRLAVSIVLMLWVSGLASAFVDNIPLTTMMVRVVTSLGNNPALGLPMAPLIWALSFGACLGGNGTLIGASANVVTAGVAEQHGYRFTFMEFFKVGFPLMLGHLVVATGYLLLCHCAFTWH